MGFVSYSIKFFEERLNLYEKVYKNKAPQTIVHEAKVLLKLLDDILDEGYKDSYRCINRSCDAVSRLRLFISANNETPFIMKNYSINKNIKYETFEYNLGNYLDLIERNMNLLDLTLDTVPDIFYDILSYTREIFKTSVPETAYCFLLRDTLLPYLAFKKWDSAQHLNIVPLFISRKFFRCVENGDGENFYDSIQNIIFEALDCGAQTFNQLRKYVKDKLNENHDDLATLVDLIRKMLNAIPQKSIMVIESGYIGTIPLLLSVLDSRVDFRLFTTIPYFYEHYKDKFYSNRFEKIREFETINCQSALFKLSSISEDADIKVVETYDNKVKDESIKELATWDGLINDPMVLSAIKNKTISP